MLLKNNIEIEVSAVFASIKKLTNQIYKLLPNREENIDWQTPLTTIIEEVGGMGRLFTNHQDIVFTLLCKLEGLLLLENEDDFILYRRTIFECLNLLSVLKGEIEACQD